MSFSCHVTRRIEVHCGGHVGEGAEASVSSGEGEVLLQTPGGHGRPERRGEETGQQQQNKGHVVYWGRGDRQRKIARFQGEALRSARV